MVEVTNRGQQRLLELTAKHGAAQKLADRIGAKPNQISQWCRGTKPNGSNRVILSKKARIPMSWWDLDPVEVAA